MEPNQKIKPQETLQEYAKEGANRFLNKPSALNELEQNPFLELDTRDENQILSEIHGDLLKELVYDITVSGKRVTNLSYSGVKEAIRHRGKIEILGDPKIEETDKTIRATIKIRDLINYIDVLGVSEADKNKPFAFVLAVNKAERNAFAKLLPVKVITETINKYLEQQSQPNNNTQPKTKPHSQIKNVTPKQTSTNQPTEKIDIDPEMLELLTTTQPLNDERLQQYPLTEGLNNVGMINNLYNYTALVPENPNINKDHNTIKSFLLGKILDKLAEKHPITYTVNATANGELLYILIQGILKEEQLKELQNATRWAFTKATEGT